MATTSGNISTFETTPAPMTILVFMENGPLFINTADRIIVTVYAFLMATIVISLNGFFMYLIAKYEQFRTPYFTILIFHSIYDLMDMSTSFFSIIFMSLSGYNTFRNSAWKCLLHRIVSGTPFLAIKHSLCLLSIERVFFFFRPFHYTRLVSIRLVICVEVVIFLVALVFNVSTTVVGKYFFSTTRFMCANNGRPWVWFAQLGSYYFLSILFVAVSIAVLYSLILKQKRAIASQTESLDLAGQNSRPKDGEKGSDVACSADGRGTASSDRESNANKIKTAVKLIGSISGVFWITFVPSLIITNILMNTSFTSDGDFLKYKIITRFSVMLTNYSWVINPLLYIYINPPVRRRVSQIVRRLCSQN